MGTAVAPQTKKSKVKAPVVRTGTAKILDGRHPAPITFDRDNPEQVAQLNAEITELRAQGFALAVEGEIKGKGYTLPADLAEDITVLAPLVGG